MTQTIGGVTSTLASFPEVIRLNVWESLLDVMLLSDIPGPSLWLRKRSACEEGALPRLRSFSVSGSVLDPSDAQRDFVGWDGQEGRETCCRIGKNVQFVEVRGNGCRRGNEILHD